MVDGDAGGWQRTVDGCWPGPADSGKDAAAPSPGRRNECRHSHTQHELRERPIYETIQSRKESR